MPNRKFQSLINALIAFVFIAAPAIIGIFFVLAYPSVPYFYMWIIALGFISYVFVLTLMFYKLNILRLQAFAFNMPLSIVLASLFVARDLAWWLMLIIAIILIFTAIPANMIVARLNRSQKKRKQAKSSL